MKKARTLAYLLPTAMGGGASPPTIYQEWADSVKSISINNKITCIAIPVRFPLPLDTDLPDVVNQLIAANVDALIGVTGCQVFLPYFRAVTQQPQYDCGARGSPNTGFPLIMYGLLYRVVLLC